MQIGITDVKNANKFWCVYEHVLQDGKIVFSGVCRLPDLLTFKDALNNSEWRALFSKGGGCFINIIHMTFDQNEARNVRSRRIAELGYVPQCNLHGHDVRTSNRAVRCNNGEIYSSQAEAARALGLHQGNLSAHLKGKTKTIGGYWFEYVDAPPIQPMTPQPPADPYPGYTGVHTLPDGTIWGVNANNEIHQLGTTQQ